MTSFVAANNHCLPIGETSATIGLVVPVVLDINTQLVRWLDDARFCKSLVSALHTSLRKRFKGIFVNCEMERSLEDHDLMPYHQKLYLIGAVLDPQYKLLWVDADVVTDGEENGKDKLKESLKGIFEVTDKNYCSDLFK